MQSTKSADLIGHIKFLLQTLPLCKGCGLQDTTTTCTTVYACCFSLSPCSAEHKSHVPSCPFLKIKDPYKITVSDVLDLERKALEWAIVSHTMCAFWNVRNHLFFWNSSETRVCKTGWGDGWYLEALQGRSFKGCRTCKGKKARQFTTRAANSLSIRTIIIFPVYCYTV